MTENIPNEAPEVTAPETSEPRSLRDSMLETYKELKAEAPATDVVEAKTNYQDDKQPENESEKAVIETAPPIQAPTSWSDEDKAVFSKLPPEAQNVIAKRESERDRFLNQQSMQYTHLKQEMDGLGSTLAPVRHLMEQNNIGMPELVKEYVNLHTLSERDPIAYLNLFAQSKGINLQQLASGQIDPIKINQQAAQSKIAELENRLNQIANKEEQQGNVYAQTEVQKFAADPANKFIDQVRDDMALLLNADKAKDLKDAYEKACRMNPDIWEQIEKEKAKLSAKEQNDKALAAKKAGGTRIRTKEMSSIAPAKSDNIRDTMREAYRELTENSAA